MTIKILFIGVTELKEKSVLQAMVDEKLCQLAIMEFQKFELYRTLGKTEYLRLENELVKVQTQNPVDYELTPADKELMTYVKDYLIYGSLMYSIPKINNKFSNTGTQRDNQINANQVDPQEARADYAYKMDAAKKLLLEYMSENSESEKCCKSKDDTTFNFTGMSLPDHRFDVERWKENETYKTEGGRIIL